MGLDRKKLQKNKEKKAAKKKTRKDLVKKKNAGIANSSVNMDINRALHYPIYQCWKAEFLFCGDTGVGTVAISRKAPQGQIILAIFLLDVFCLGVKNAGISMMFQNEYQAKMEILTENEGIEEISVACAKKLIEGAEKYGNELGFLPHEDYHQAKKIFANIKTKNCPDSFVFGRNGKPYYSAGPYESESLRQKIIKQLEKKCGPDGFDYFFPLEKGVFIL